MADTSVFLNLMKKTAIEVMNASQPCALQYGIVLSTSPFEVSLDENGKIVLTESFLVFTKNVMDYEAIAEIEGEKKTIKIKNALEAEDRVLLLRMQGGSKYIILDKL